VVALSRRRVLGWLGLAGLLPAVGWRSESVGDDANLGHRLAAFLSYPPESAAVIGAAYLAAAAEERSVQFLHRHLEAAAVVPRRPAVWESDEAVTDRLRRRIRADFEANEVALVRGWVLSRTEARLCGLVALESRKRHGSQSGHAT